jgi:diketogulonate reductase-like aldo/keto reductase
MGYSPLDHGSLLRHPLVKKVALNRGMTAAQIALAWVLRRSPEVTVMAKASTRAHVRENHNAMDIEFSREELMMLDEAFPAPRRAEPLEVL